MPGAQTIQVLVTGFDKNLYHYIKKLNRAAFNEYMFSSPNSRPQDSKNAKTTASASNMASVALGRPSVEGVMGGQRKIIK
ncbi:hypothetical protein OB236_14425 [Paenibacillus sp. WQ 127069]|uniref:Uncharacterized protein n=1 Tax=Paenibacillus baimaensis TaxID=2982185 RepID=A0ABT2UF82_9BACL|nr:hypothetical protein [Paenibacillus sp. WQ 127069]